MKSAVIRHYDHLSGRGCYRFLNPKHAAITAAIYALNISILVVLIYSWRISVNMKKVISLEDVYYGVQIAYFAIIGTQLFMLLLSIVLLFGIYKLLRLFVQEKRGPGRCRIASLCCSFIP
nr:uncharacterized protein LOC111416878 [Onthophagus taurus]XP_022904752.1 uncharacterized protein LOC111416878 [Onthophagus taurus]